MYKWNLKNNKVRQIKNDRSIIVDVYILSIIMDDTKKTDSLHKSIKQLKLNGDIPDNISFTTYRKNILKYEPYIMWKKQKDDKYYSEMSRLIELQKKGYSLKEISEITGRGYASVWSVLRGDVKKKENNRLNIGKEKARELVDYWNKYGSSTQTPTYQTIKAFKLLGLEIPKL